MEATDHHLRAPLLTAAGKGQQKVRSAEHAARCTGEAQVVTLLIQQAKVSQKHEVRHTCAVHKLG